MNNFQTILIAVFLAFFVFAVLIFSGAINISNIFGSKSTGLATGTILVWGTLPDTVFQASINNISTVNKNLSLSYSQKDISTYQQDLIEAFANGTSPDLFIITPDMIKKNSNFIYKIPYANYPRKTFTDSFIDGASIYLDSDGIIGYPLMVDPIVLYYNKNILSNEGIIYPPQTWDELFTMNSSLTKRDNLGTINQSMIALGQYDNVTNAKDILATLFIQNDNTIVKKNNSTYTALLKDNPSSLSVTPAEAVIKFFTEFSDQSNTAYSWNSSLPNSLDMFTSGKLAFYIGKASDLFNIQSINPNLSFNVNQIPQIKNSTVKRTFGDIYAISVSNKSSNLISAFQVALDLSSSDNINSMSVSASLPPASRSLLSKKPNDNPYLFTFFNSAVISMSWPDPDKVRSDSIFKELIDNVLSNSLSLNQAINKAQGQLEQVIIK